MTYHERVLAYEAQGLTTSDAQGAADVDLLKAMNHWKGDNTMLYYPCIFDNRSGHIIKQVRRIPTNREKCERYLKRHYLMLWRNGEAIPQLATRTDLIPAWNKS